LSRITYLNILVIGVVLERWVNYIWFEVPVIWGQPGNVLVPFAFFALAFALWLRLPLHPIRPKQLTTFLMMMVIAWLVHLVLYRYHGDAFNYSALLYVPILLMLLIKPPSAGDAWASSLIFAWSVTIVLVATRALEMTGLLGIKDQSANVIRFDESNYFLPLNDFLGIEGRWPGPFGHNGDTSMMAALIIIIACAHWTRASWVFLVVGAGTLLLTNGRASIGAVVAGLVVFAMFTRVGRVGQLPAKLRVSVGSILLLAGALFMFARPAGLTGRQTIWPSFLELWAASPWLGVGSAGIANGNEISQRFEHAHSLYIDELVRWGLIGFIAQFAALGFGLYLAGKAATKGAPGPLAVLITYFVTGITEPRNNWIVPSATGFLVILMVIAAASYLANASTRYALDSDAGDSRRQPRAAKLSRVDNSSRGLNETQGPGRSPYSE